MTFVATIIGNPADKALTGAHMARAAAALHDGGPPVWLASGIAADIPFASTDDDPRVIAARVREALDGPFDVIVQPITGRAKRLFLADMDSTMIEQECIDELAAHVGLKDHVAAITERAMRGEIAFEPALRERVALLKGLPLAVVDSTIAGRITLTAGARTAVATMRARGVYTALVSGGFTVFTGPVGRMLGFDEDRSNVLDVEAERLTGTVREPILGKEAKRERLIALRAARVLQPSDVLAVGDGANDLAMLGEAGLGVAFRAKPAVAAAAHAQVNHGDLTALLYAQGIAQADFITG